MKEDDAIQGRGRKPNVQAALSLFTIVLGVALLIFMVTTEDEPGAIPLLLIVIGVGWYAVTRARTQSRLDK